MSDQLLITFNAGSSTVKIGVFERDGSAPRRLAKGVIDFRKAPLTFHLVEGPEVFDVELSARASDDLSEVLAETFGFVGKHFDLSKVSAAGHRVVHGGDAFSGPVVIDDAVLSAMDALTKLAPLHQPQSLRVIRAIRQLRPELPQSASFDTAFHRSNDPIVQRFAIPRAMHDEGIKRYGFHGLSYASISGSLSRRFPTVAHGKVIAAHLGSGASLCALYGGASRDTSMGFSTLDGIPMATRCGALDPGVLLHLLGDKRLPLNEVEAILYHRSGLLGVSGISADSRELLESAAPEAREAIELFTLRIAGEIGRLAMSAGGLDAIVFTAGIGENQPRVRAEVCARLAWLGLVLDPERNAQNAEVISAAGSRITVLVIPTDEEHVIAAEACAVLGRAA